MIVNSVAHNLNLQSGVISQAIVQAAGQSIQTEVKQQYHGGLQDGQHVTSSGGSLKCKRIFHAVLCGWVSGHEHAQQVGGNIEFVFFF